MISVLLPTVRPNLFLRAFESVRAAAGVVPYEVVVVADFPMNLDCNAPEPHLHCRWVESERRGPVDATNVALAQARGQFLFAMNDESVLEPGMLETLYTACDKDRRRLYTPRHVPAYEFKYFGLPFAPFPFLHRELLTTLGGLFDPAYYAFYADPDLGMRAHAMGISIEVVEAAVINHMNGDDEVKRQNWDRHFNADQATFRARWGHLGEFRDC